jgi:hypothetical protein
MLQMLLISTMLSTVGLSQKQRKNGKNSLETDMLAMLTRWQQPPMNAHMRMHVTKKYGGVVMMDTLFDYVLAKSENAFFIRMDDIEQIGNDSMIVVLNKSINQVSIYVKDSLLMSKMQGNMWQNNWMNSPEKFGEFLSQYRVSKNENGSGYHLVAVNQLENNLPVAELEYAMDDGSQIPKALKQIGRKILQIPFEDSKEWDDAGIAYQIINANGRKLAETLVEDVFECKFEKINKGIPEAMLRVIDVVEMKHGEWVLKPAYVGFELSYF